MEGKIITCCGDCVYYDWRKHKCKNGYNKESNAQDHFYDDCNVFKDLEEHEKQIRETAIDECIKIVKFHRDSWNGIEWAIRDIEELKAGANNGTDNQ